MQWNHHISEIVFCIPDINLLLFLSNLNMVLLPIGTLAITNTLGGFIFNLPYGLLVIIFPNILYNHGSGNSGQITWSSWFGRIFSCNRIKLCKCGDPCFCIRLFTDCTYFTDCTVVVYRLLHLTFQWSLWCLLRCKWAHVRLKDLGAQLLNLSSF